METNLSRFTSSQPASPTDGVAYFRELQNPTWGPGRAPVAISVQVANTHILPTSLRTAIFGANVQTALREEPEQTRALLVEMLSTTLEVLGTPNGLKTEKAIAIATKRLVDEYGNFTIEDWRLCMHEMQAGRSINHYNNTNLEWLIKCFQAYDERKLAELRAYHAEEAQKFQDESAHFYREALEKTVGNTPINRTLAELLTEPPKSSWEEREAMARRDTHRREAQVKKQMRELVRAQYRAKRKNNPNT